MRACLLLASLFALTACGPQGKPSTAEDSRAEAEPVLPGLKVRFDPHRDAKNAVYSRRLDLSYRAWAMFAMSQQWFVNRNAVGMFTDGDQCAGMDIVLNAFSEEGKRLTEAQKPVEREFRTRFDSEWEDWRKEYLKFFPKRDEIKDELQGTFKLLGLTQNTRTLEHFVEKFGPIMRPPAEMPTYRTDYYRKHIEEWIGQTTQTLEASAPYREFRRTADAKK